MPRDGFRIQHLNRASSNLNDAIKALNETLEHACIIGAKVELCIADQTVSFSATDFQDGSAPPCAAKLSARMVFDGENYYVH